MTAPPRELLPCPFYGCVPRLNEGDDWSQIVCENDECSVSAHTEFTRLGVELSIAEWNRRAAPAPRAELSDAEVDGFARWHMTYTEDAMAGKCGGRDPVYEAFRAGYALAIAPPAPAEVRRLYPRIVLTTCEYCAGTGRRVVRCKGRVWASNCTNCAGRGTVTGEA